MFSGMLELPTFVAGNVMFDDSVTGICPVPVMFTKCGAPDVVSLIVIVPVSAPVTTGAKFAVIVQLCPGVSVTPEQLPVSEKSPLDSTELTVIFTKPVFDTVTFCPALEVFTT